MGVIGFGRVECGSSAQHFLLLRLFSFHSSGKLIFMHSLTLHWDSLTWRLSALAYYTSSLFYPIQYISPYTIWPLNLPWNISRARCWKTPSPLAVICAARAAFSWQLITIHDGLQQQWTHAAEQHTEKDLSNYCSGAKGAQSPSTCGLARCHRNTL